MDLFRVLRFVLIMFLYFQASTLFGQCPQLNDGNGVPSAAPYWIAPCNGADYTVFIQSPTTIGSWTIDWGDGSPIDAGTDITPPAFRSHTYAATVDTFIVTLTEVDSGCVVQGVVVMELQVTAELGIPGGVATQICAPDDISFANNTNQTSAKQVSETTVFTWDYGDGSPIEVYDYTNLNQIVTHTYLPNTVNCQTTVILTAENYCGLSTATFNPIEVWEVDEAEILPSQTLLCYPDTEVLFQNDPMKNCLPNNNAQRYEYWNFGDYWGVGSDSIIDWQAYDPPARPGYNIAYPGLGSYSVMLIDSNFCGVDTAFVTVNIVNQPTAVLNIADDTICVGETASFINTSGGAANSFSWNFDDGAGWQTFGPGNQTNTYPISGDYTITVVANITGGTAACTDTATVDLHVLPSPIAGINIGNNNGCDTMTTLFTDGSAGAVSWNWDFGNGNSSTAQNPPSEFYNAVGNYNVALTVTSANLCSDIDNETVNVFQSPAVSFTTANVCVNQTATFTDGSTSALGDPIISWFWNFDDGNNSNSQNPTNVYPTANTYDVSLFVSTAFCSNSDTVPITVEPEPTAVMAPDIVAGCTPLTVNFTNSSSGATTYLWDFADGSTSNLTDPTHVFVNNSTTDTTYRVVFVAYTAFGCTDTVFQNILVSAAASSSFTHDAVLGCAPVIVNFTNTSTGGNIFTWDFGDGTGSTLQDPVHTYQNTTPFIEVYTAELIVESVNGCRDTSQQDITVYPELDITFSTFPDSGCSPLTVTFPPAVGAVGWDWDFGDGGTSTQQTPTHTYVNTSTNNQTFNIRLITSSPFGCLDTSYNSVIVFPKPKADFSVDDSLGCHPLIVNYTNSSTGGSNYYWDFGDGNTTATTSGLVTHTFVNTSSVSVTYSGTLIAETEDGCLDTAYQTIGVYPEVTTDFFALDSVGCHPLSVNFVEQTSGAASFNWDFGNGSTSTAASPSFTFTNSTTQDFTYIVQLVGTTTYGCSDTANKNIVVYPKPVADFQYTPQDGCQPLTVDFTNNSTVSTLYNWDFGDGTLSNTTTANFSHTYTNTGNASVIHDIELIASTTNGCSDTITNPVEVYPQIIADFQTSDTIGCSPLIVAFTNLSTNAQQYNWTFGDGNAATTTFPTNVFVNTGTTDQIFTTRLVVTSAEGCTDTLEQEITVHPKPIADFSYTPAVGCHPLTVDFTNNSTLSTIYYWDLGDGTITDTTATNFSHIYSNTSIVPVIRTVELIATTNNGCTDTVSHPVEIYPQIIAAFSTSDTVGCSPHSVSFSDLSTNAQQYNWDFGDGNTSTLASPANTFINTDTIDQVFTSTLVVTSTEGCTDTLEQQILVHPKPVAQFSTNAVDGCHPLNLSITDESVIAVNYAWDLGDGTTTDTTTSFNHIYVNNNAVSITNNLTLIVESQFSCFDTTELDIVVYPFVMADFTNILEGCSPVQAGIVNNSVNTSTYLWDFGDGSADNTETPTKVFTNNSVNDTTYTITLIATSIYQCSDTATGQILVHPSPLASFVPSPLSQLYPSTTVSVTNGTNAGFWQYDWDFGDGGVSAAQNPTDHVYGTWGDYTIKLLVSSAFCSDSTEEMITIIPPVPIADFIGPQEGCRPVTVDFINTSQYENTWFWEFGDGATSTEENPSHTYFSDGTYTVKLSITGDGGVDTEVKQNIISVHDYAIAFFDSNPKEVSIPNQGVQFFNFSNNATIYNWDFGDGTTSTEEEPEHFYQEAGVFDVTLISDNEFGCPDTFVVEDATLAERAGTIKYPNAFTPDPAGGSRGGMYDPNGYSNDVFFPIYEGVIEYHMMIFNRWGELMFESFDVNIGWDGYYRDRLAPQDVYVWKVVGRYINQEKFTESGDLTLIR